MSPNDNAQTGQSHATLKSWKEIASYFDRGVRTVQRWEQELHLPVHRTGEGKRAPVYAVVSELKLWLTASGPDSSGNSRMNPTNPDSGDRTTQLRQRLYELSKAVAESSVRHQRQTEALQKNVVNLRLQILRKRP